MQSYDSRVEFDRSAWRLLPSEEILWEGRPAAVPRDRLWVLLPMLFFAIALVSALFAKLLDLAELPGVSRTIATACLLGATAIAASFAPQLLFGDHAYLVTDRRILWRRGRHVRSMERDRLTYARIRWHRSVPVVGHLELVIAVPFGPLARRLRFVFRDVREPDRLLAIIRGEEPSEHAGDRTGPLTERHDRGESVVSGGHPGGYTHRDM